MFSDQAHNLRLMAEQQRLRDKEDNPSPVRNFSWRSLAVLCVSALLVIAFLFFHYSNQRYVLDLVRDKNEKMEERLLLLSVQLENLKTAIDSSVRENYFLKQEVVSITGQRDSALGQWQDSQIQVKAFERELGQLHQDLAKVKSEQKEINLFVSREVGETLDVLDRKTQALAARLEQAGEKGGSVRTGVFLGTIAFFKEDYSFVVFSHSSGTDLEAGQFVAVHRGGKRLAILKIIEVRDTVSAAVVEELWSPIQKGDEARQL